MHPVVAGRGPLLLDGIRDQIYLELVEQRAFRSARSCNATGPSLSKGPELVTTLEAAVTSTDSVFIESVNSEPGGLS